MQGAANSWSCHLEAIKVSKEDELLMAQIIDGVIDGAAYRRQLFAVSLPGNTKKPMPSWLLLPDSKKQNYRGLPTIKPR